MPGSPIRCRFAVRAAALALLAPLTLTGCNPFTPANAENAENTEADAAAEGQSWIVVTQGQRAAEPEKPAPPPPPEKPHEPPLPEPEVPHAGEVHEPACPPAPITGGQINGLDVTTGAGTATVSWYHSGDPGVVSYRLTAVPQRVVAGRQPDLAWHTIGAKHGCRTMTATLDGLDRDAGHIIWLDAVRTNATTDGTRSSTIARSGVVYTR